MRNIAGPAVQILTTPSRHGGQYRGALSASTHRRNQRCASHAGTAYSRSRKVGGRQPLAVGIKDHNFPIYRGRAPILSAAFGLDVRPQVLQYGRNDLDAVSPSATVAELIRDPAAPLVKRTKVRQMGNG